MEDAHFCTALMPLMGDCRFSEASALFVEFREMKLCMVSIEHGSGRAGDLKWDLYSQSIFVDHQESELAVPT